MLEVSDYPACERTYATLRIYSGSYGPDEVTKRHRVEPTDWQRRGESRKPGGRPVELHGWFLSSDGVVESCDVRRHLNWLLSVSAPRADAILALQREGCRMDVSCYWVSASGHGGLSVGPAQMGELARLGLELWFDVYLGGNEEVTEPGE